MVHRHGLDYRLDLLVRDRVQLYAGDTGRRVEYTGMGYIEEKLLSAANIESLAALFRLRRIAVEEVAAEQCSVADLADRCRQRAQEFLATERYRSGYDPELFTARADLAFHLGQFLAGPETALLLAGPSGIGKSWEVCRWVDTLLGATAAPEQAVLPLPVATLRLPPGIADSASLMEAVMRQLQIGGRWKDWRRRLLALREAASPWTGTLVIVLEALNEYEGDRKALYRAVQALLAELAEQRLSGVKLLYTSREEYLPGFFAAGTAKQVLPDPAVHYHDHANPRRDPEGRVQAWLVMARWEDRELAEAYPRYQSRGGPTTPLAAVQTDASLVSLLSHPYWLKLACQTYGGRELPRGLVMLDLFRERVEQKLRSQPERWEWMKHLLAAMEELGTAAPPEDDLIQHPALREALLDREPSGLVSGLVQDQFLQRASLPQPESDLTLPALRFAHEGLGEYLLSERWLDQARTVADGIERFFRLPFWEDLAQRAEGFPLLAGGGVSLLARLGRQDPERVGSWIARLANELDGCFHEQFLHPVIRAALELGDGAQAPLVRAALDAKEPSATEALGTFFHGLALDYYATRWQWLAEPAVRRALDVCERLAAAHPERVDLAQHLGTTCNNLALFLVGHGRGEEAEGLYRRALDIRERLAAAHPERVDLAQELGTTCNNLAAFLVGQGRGEEAEGLYRRALDIRERLAAAHPERVDLAQQLGTTCNNLAAFLVGQGRGEEAEGLYRRALDVCERLAAAHPERVDLAQQLGRPATTWRCSWSTRGGGRRPKGSTAGRSISASGSPPRTPSGWISSWTRALPGPTCFCSSLTAPRHPLVRVSAGFRSDASEGRSRICPRSIATSAPDSVTASRSWLPVCLAILRYSNCWISTSSFREYLVARMQRSGIRGTVSPSPRFRQAPSKLRPLSAEQSGAPIKRVRVSEISGADLSELPRLHLPQNPLEFRNEAP